MAARASARAAVPEYLRAWQRVGDVSGVALRACWPVLTAQRFSNVPGCDWARATQATFEQQYSMRCVPAMPNTCYASPLIYYISVCPSEAKSYSSVLATGGNVSVACVCVLSALVHARGCCVKGRTVDYSFECVRFPSCQ